MVIVTRQRPRATRFRYGHWAVALLGFFLARVLAGSAHGQNPQDEQHDGQFITVPNPITDSAVREIKSTVKTALERKKRRLRTIVFDFNPNDAASGTSEPFPCVALAYYVRDLRLGNIRDVPQLKTVAFVHNKVTMHTVLPVLACGELIMSRDAQIAGQDRPLDNPAIRQAYEDIARSSPAEDLVLRLIDPDVEGHKVRTQAGVRYVDKKKLDKLKQEKDKGGVLDEGMPPGLGAGAVLLGTSKARTLGLCKESYETRPEVANALKLAPHSLREDSLAGRTVVPWRIEVRGTINKGKLDSLWRRIKKAIGRDANLLFLELDCEGGETQDAARFARELRDLKANSGHLSVKTVAYIPPGRSLGAATFLALGCSEIVMRKDAVLGGFDYLKGDSDALN